MRWQPGGNLEPVRIICETDWKQCIQAILRYIWTEIVTDVVDCLTTESTLWRIIAICIICIMLLRIFYVKRKWVNRPTPSKYILSRVGCKVDDLELKINILTYKLQYGTWPLPHQIQKSALKKQLRNLRLTLSTSSDRKEWIKHILLSSTSNTYLSPPKLDSISVHRIKKLFDTKTGYFMSENQRDVYPTDQSDIKSSKTSSVESIKKTNLEGVHRRGLSKSDNLEGSRTVTRQLSLLPRKESDYFWKKRRKQKRPRLSMSRSKITACDKYTESIVECKRFLKELKESNKKLELNCSSSAITNDSSSFHDSWIDEKSSLHAQTTDARNASRRCEIIREVKGRRTLVKVEREKKDLNMFMDISNGVQIDRIESNGLLSSLNSKIRDDFSNNLMMDEPKSILSQNNNVIEMSQMRLYLIKRKLESLDNVLRAYSTLDSCVTRNVERSKVENNEIQAIYRNVADTLDAIKLEIENINETKRNEITFEVSPKEYSDKMLQTTSSDYELFESIDSERSSSISMKSYTERKIEDPLDLAIVGKDQRSEKRSIKTDATFALSRSNHVIILDQESLLNDFQRQRKKVLSGYPVSLGIEEDPSILSTNSSRLEISKDSDLENKSTATLIREALRCKRELLSRVKLHEFYSNVEVRKEIEETRENFEDVDTAWLDTEKSFQSKLLDIIAEESTSSCTEKTSRTYIFLRMKRSSEMSDGSSSNVEVDDKKQKEYTKDKRITSEMFDSSKEPLPIVSSRYFSFNDLSILPKYQNIVLREPPSDSKSSLPKRNESIKSTNSLQGKRRYEEVATWDDDDDIDDDRKRRCHRDDQEKKLLISTKRLRRAKSVPESSRKKEVRGCTNVRGNINEVVLKTTRNPSSAKSFGEAANDENTIPRKNENESIVPFETEDLLSWNRTTDSSSGGSIKCQFTIDNGSMTNFFSSNDSNLEICKKYSSSKEKDETVYGQDLSLRRRPGMLSFAQFKMNTLLADENDIFKNPYFVGDATLSEATCGETIELNLIPISVSIDSHESNIFAVTRSKIFDDPNNLSSTLRISYNDDLETGNVDEIDENDRNDRSDKKEIQVVIPDDRQNIISISDRATKVGYNNDERKQVERKLIFNETTKRSNITSSRSNVISEKSSSYFTGDTSSSMSKADFESCRISESNVSANSSFKEIDIQKDILESCIDSCIDLLRKIETNNNNESLRSLDLTSSECVSNENERSNETSVSYVEAIDWKSSNEVNETPIESNLKQLKNKSEGFIFDGSIRYKKAPVDEQNVKRNSRGIDSNWSKCKKTNVDGKSKDSIKSERPTYSRRSITGRIKSNLSIIGDKDNAASNSTTVSSNARPNSCNLSQERSSSYKNDFSSRSAVFPQCDDRRSTTTEEGKRGKTKFGKTETHSNHALSTPKSFSKSCIPILKSRLDARRTEHICRPKSPMRGPLTMAGSCRDKINNNEENVNEVNPIPTEGSSADKKESRQHLDNSKTLVTRFKTGSSKESTNVIDENYSNNASRERTIIYVNMINHYDHNVTRILDPEKFLEYTSKGGPIARNVNESDAKLENDVSSSSVIMAQEKDTLPKLVTIVSSVTNEANNDENDSNGTSNVFTGTSKNFWFVTIHQKEMEVSVKPSVTDTSTSTSDFLKIDETVPLHEHKIFGMPKELTNEEYSYLFEILTRKQNLGHLKEIENLCNRLRLGNKNLE